MNCSIINYINKRLKEVQEIQEKWAKNKTCRQVVQKQLVVKVHEDDKLIKNDDNTCIISNRTKNIGSCMAQSSYRREKSNIGK